MIDFNCIHCGNHFQVAEEHAGRSGWCKVCKGSVVVPMAPFSKVAAPQEADLAHLLDELEALKATRAELQSRIELAEPLAARAAEAEADRESLSERADAAEREKADLEQALEEAAERTNALEALLEEGRAEVERLTSALDEARRDREAAERALQEAQAAGDVVTASNRNLEATVEQLRLEATAAAAAADAKAQSLEQELEKAEERSRVIDALETSLARAGDRMDELGSHVEQMDSDISRELEAAEDLAVETADGLKRLSEVLVAQQTALDQLESGEELQDESASSTIPLTLAIDEEETAEPSELESESPELTPQSIDEHDRAVADAFLRFIEG